MGSSDSRLKFEHGHIFLQTDKPFYIAGEAVTGHVYLGLEMPYPADHIDIQVKGKEKCKWKDTYTTTHREGDRTVTRHHTVIRRGENKIFFHRTALFHFPMNTAAPGQYAFPFSFMLPSSLPASLYFCGGKSSRAKITYHVKAIIEPAHGSNIKEMKYKQRLIVRQPVFDMGLNRTQGDREEVNACCCCCSKGHASLTCQFEKEAYVPGEVCRALADINNSECSIECKGLVLKLEQKVELRGDGHEFKEDKTLVQRDFEGIGANEKTDGLNRFLELSTAGLRNEVRDKKKKEILPEDRNYGEMMQPTANGHIVKFYYELSVTSRYDVCCANTPKVKIPLTIYPPPLPFFGQFQAPPNWNP